MRDRPAVKERIRLIVNCARITSEVTVAAIQAEVRTAFNERGY